MPALKPGTPAPNFSLPSTPDQKVSLSEFRGRPVVLVCYPADWSPVCSDQLALYNELLPEFALFDAEILGISVDGVWCHIAFGKDRKPRRSRGSSGRCTTRSTSIRTFWSRISSRSGHKSWGWI